jgi:hypothetical protein
MCGLSAVPTSSSYLLEDENSGRDQGVSSWGGEDSNLRPTDYESGHAQALDLQEFLNLRVRSIT